MKVRPAQRIRGQFTPSGDKSISHRGAMIAALAKGASKLSNFSPGYDCATTVSCLRQLGIRIAATKDSQIVTGSGIRGFTESSSLLDCGNSGSTIRMIAGLLAGQTFVSQLTGDDSLKSRPMRRIIEPLELMGAKIESIDGKPPLRIFPGSPLTPIRYELPVASAQVKSAILFAGLYANGNTSVVEHASTRDHTERMLAWFGCAIQITPQEKGAVEISLADQKNLLARDVVIPGDISSAAFMIAVAALLPGSELTIHGVGLNPTRTQFLSQLKSFGAKITISEVVEVSNEPVGVIQVRGGLDSPDPAETVRIDDNTIGQLIDELPLLAVIGTQLPGGIEIRGAAELRVKESDRIASTVANLRAMGADVEDYPDGLRVDGPTRLKGARLDSHGDHRIALAFSIAALIAEGESEIAGPECVGISFPGFFELLESLVVR
ncbi:MAG TPA: 3-phosphoshikimate 1-carboxyvinyltransferase [Pyrinomonadaceae bacterium]